MLNHDLAIPAFLVIPQVERAKAWENFRHTHMHRDAPARSFDLPRNVEPAALALLNAPKPKLAKAKKSAPKKRRTRKPKAK
jgi:hypothetical protein